MSTRTPRQELIPRDQDPFSLPIPEVPTIPTVYRTIFNTNRATRLSEAHDELFKATIRLREELFRLRTTDARMGAAFVLEAMNHDSEVLRLQQARERMILEHEVALARSRAELLEIAQKLQPPPPPSLRREERERDEDPDATKLLKGIRRISDRIEKLIPEINATKDRYDRFAAEGYLSPEQAEDLKDKLDDLVKGVLAKP